jgi:hypothetical protein
VMRDWQALFDYATKKNGAYQLWGREPLIEIVTASGSDETAQRADAVEVISRKPFMVVDATATGEGGAPVFSSVVANAKIIVASASTTAKIGEAQSPYRWNYGADQNAGNALVARFVGRTLSGKKAQWAGDKKLASKTRNFGVVHPTSDDFDIAAFQQLVKENGGTIAKVVSFDPKNPNASADLAPTMVTQLKGAGVTSVVVFANNAMMAPLTKAATAQEYSPEWIITGYAYQDFDGFARAYDQEQMRHAFGFGVLAPYAPPGENYLDLFKWYWGPSQGNNWSITPGIFHFVYDSIHYAGPTLTAENVKKGLFSAPALGGAADGTVGFQYGYGRTVGLPYDSYSLFGADRAYAWWNADVTGASQAIGLTGKGLFFFVNDGSRVGYDNIAKAQPKFFDAKTSVGDVPPSASFPDGVIPPAAPCTGCPSSGGA